jgi:hypothetical protein
VKDFLVTLENKTEEFGNHYNKYLQAVNTSLSLIIQRLEENKKRDAVHILHPAYDFPAELRLIAEVSANDKEALQLTGTFFALQFLQINKQTIDVLKMEVMAAEGNRIPVYRKFMRIVGNNFRMLTTHYIVQLMNILIDKTRCPDFAILGVGTKSDQDDIDVGIVDDGTKDRDLLNRGIARISQEMFKFVTTFHFHLSEHVGDRFYSASIDEYKKILKDEISDYVIINEMLSAALIAGSRDIFRKFRKEVTNRYFYHANTDNRYHEGYLRGVIGEVYSLLEKPISSTRINFKEDGLRLIKNTICVQKTVFDIDEVNAWDIIEKLKTKDKKRVREYASLERSLTFFEIFRYLYQLLVTQDEEIVLEQHVLSNIRRVARVLGYSDMGMCSSEQHVLMHYYEHIQNIRRLIPIFISDIKNHIRATSIFTPLFNTAYSGNIAKDFIQKFRFFRGTSFWDDILDDLKSEHVLERFVTDVNKLLPDDRARIVKEYIEWFRYDFYSLIKLLTLLGKHKSSSSLFIDLNTYLLHNIDTVPDVVRNMSYMFNRFPHIVNDYLALQSEEGLKFFLHLFTRKTYERDIAKIVGDIEYLIGLHLSSSMFFKRYFLRILNKYPDSIRLVQKPHRLLEFADGIRSDISSVRTFDEEKTKLGDYYDLEMVRVGLKTLSSVHVEETNAEFTAFSDSYINSLFDICRREVDSNYSKRIITDDLLAVFASGGHAREQAYDDDFDIIVVLNSDNQPIIEYCNKIISKMNREIIKRGTIPHHRFADYFGRFVILFKELQSLLAEDRPDIFIEKSQILGARLMLGSHRFEREFTEHIVKPYIFSMKHKYIAQMVEELTSRHTETDDTSHATRDDIKECIGGLRDIEMLMLIIKAKYEIITPVNSRLFHYVAEHYDSMRDEIVCIAEKCNFLKNLRDIYRLTAGASDVIMPDALHQAASIMGYQDNAMLYHTFKETFFETTTLIKRLIETLRNNS